MFILATRLSEREVFKSKIHTRMDLNEFSRVFLRGGDQLARGHNDRYLRVAKQRPGGQNEEEHCFEKGAAHGSILISLTSKKAKGRA
jgi:hypothetical protein